MLSRVFGIEGPAGERGTEIELWRRAEECTPAAAEVAVYTQAIMDFGATLCTRHAPLCMHCPLQTRCAAFALGRVAELPQPRPRRARQTRRVVMLLAQQADGSVLLQRRPAHGVWGGLWTPPEFASREDAESYCSQYLAPLREPLRSLPELHHAFTHFDLAITPLQGRCANGHGVMDGEGMLWYNAREPALIGMPAPVAALLAALR